MVTSAYHSRRSSSWLKIKAILREDGVVVGWVPSPAGRHFASLLLAFREPEGLRYVGRVGIGFTARAEQDAFARLSPHVRNSPPPGVTGLDADPANSHWASPRFTAAIDFGGLTGDRRPADDVPFNAVVAAAQLIRRILASASLKSFPLISGGKGIHVVVPLDGSQGWPAIETFTSTLARTLARAEPERYVATASKARRKGRIYIDWLRNKRSATAIVPYSLRARPTASIAMPVTWLALAGLQTAAHFTATHLTLASSDPWRGFFAIRQRVSSSVLNVLQKFRYS